MRSLLITVYFSVFFSCFFGKAQTSTNNGNVGTTNPNTSPANISVFEARGRLITQNFQPSPSGIQTTGNFGSTARWNSMGSLNIPGATQILNGFRTQTDGKGLAWGHSIPNGGGGVSNSFIEIIGNNTFAPSIIPTTDDPQNLGTSSGNLDFRYAESPSGANSARRTALTIQPVINVNGQPQFDAFTYARTNCLIGQLQAGKYGGLGNADAWIGSGNVGTSAGSYIGTRVQSQGTNLITGIEGGTNAFIQFNNPNLFSSSSPVGLLFKGDVGTGSTTDIMRMEAEGRIQTGTNPSALPLDISSINYNLFVSGKVATGNSSISNIGVGVYARPSNVSNPQQGGRQYAVFAEANGGNQSTGSYALSGTVLNEGPNDYSGIFSGKVLAGGVLISSDKRLKKDIKTETSAIEKIMLLKPVSYTYDKSVSKWMNLEYERTSHGFIADEVKEIFPEMVNEFAEPVMGNAKEVQAARMFKAVNYIQLISVLTKAMQEQQAEIIALKNEIKSNTTFVLNNKTAIPTEVENAAFSLNQNVPNPFSEAATISYTIPQNAGKAVLAVFDLNGKMLLQYNLQQGKGQVKIQANQLTAGMYIYSLIVNGQEVVSKRMVVGREY